VRREVTAPLSGVCECDRWSEKRVLFPVVLRGLWFVRPFKILSSWYKIFVPIESLLAAESIWSSCETSKPKGNSNVGTTNG